MTFPQVQQPQISSLLLAPRVLGIAGDNVTGPLHLGIRVDRAAANLPQSTQADLFTVSGGRVLVAQIVGEVTTVIQTLLNNTKLVSNPTVGADLDLCAVLDITADAVGTLYGITGVFADALQGAGPGALRGQLNGIVLPIGSLALNCSASATGQVKWSAFYVPLDLGAQMVAV